MAETDKERLDVVKGERRLADLLNESQRRSLTIMLRRIELAAWRLEDQLTQETMPQLVLTRFTHLPGPDQQTALLQVAKHIRQEVAQLASAYNVEVTEEDLLRSILAEFTLLWCDLEDSRPHKLRRYGALNPQAEEMLGPSIQRLIELVLAVSEVASGKQESIHLWQEARKSNPEGSG